MDYETPAQRQARIGRDLEALRILAWCVQRMRYAAEPMRVEGGRRGKGRIATFTFYVESADLVEARDAVREIKGRRAQPDLEPPRSDDERSGRDRGQSADDRDGSVNRTLLDRTYPRRRE